ncbi:MAG: DUF4340 domain-containing protein [Chromatiales bacterium]|nr:DUF4340 domain-containing protein [Chromatiales bacterium]
MPKRAMVNLLLLLVVIALGLVVWLTPEKDQAQNLAKLTNLSPNDISHIRISNNNGPTFTLERSKNGWWMSQPYRIAANTPRIDILLDIVATPSHEQFPLPKDRLAEFGLDKPRATMQFNSTEMIFGGTHPYNYRRYVQIGNQVHLINDNFPHHFLAAAEAYVSHSLLPHEAKITRISTPDWSIQKVDNRWQLTPENGDISTDALVRKIEDWQTTWAAQVSRVETPGATPQITIALEGSQQPMTLLLEKRDNGIRLTRADNNLSYTLPNGELLQPPAGTVE